MFSIVFPIYISWSFLSCIVAILFYMTRLHFKLFTYQCQMTYWANNAHINICQQLSIVLLVAPLQSIQSPAVTTEDTDDSRLQTSGSRASCYCKSTPWAVSKSKGGQKMHALYCSMPKGTSPDEATSNSEKLKSVAFSVIVLHLPDGRQALR